MKCPSCGTTKEIKWFLRHQPENEDDTSNLANVITILCTECGKNETYYIADCLEDIFPSWKEKQIDLSSLTNMFNNTQNNFEIESLNEFKRNCS